MAVNIPCPANQRKGPYAASAGSIVGLSVTVGGNAYVQYTEQPPTQQSLWQTWPNGSTTAQAPELDVSMYNALVQVICTAGTATLTISDPDDINFRAAVDWKSQIATQGSLPTPQIVAGTIVSDGTNARFATANNASSAVSTFAVPYQYPGSDFLIGPDWVAPLLPTAASIQNAYNYSSSHGFPAIRLAPGSTYSFGDTQVILADSAGSPIFDGVRSVPDLICHGGMAIIDASGQLSKRGALYYNVASGVHCYGKIQNVIFQSCVCAIELDGINGLRIDNCEFAANTTAVWMHNKQNGRFTEFNTIWNSVFRNNNQRAVEYSCETTTTSFHGSGLMLGNIINIGTDGIAPILINSSASGGASSQPYNSPFYATVFGNLTTVAFIFESYNLASTFYGHIQVESPGPIMHGVGGTGVVGFSGQVTVLSQNQFDSGTARQFLLADDLQLMANGSIARRGYRYSEASTQTAGSTQTTGMDRVLNGMEITVTLRNAGNTYYFMDQITCGMAGSVPWMRVTNLGGQDSSNLGAPYYSLDTSGQFQITAYAACSSYIDCRLTGQDPFNNPTLSLW